MSGIRARHWQTPVMDLHDLLGTWSVEAQYGPGAMEDFQLHLRPDGLGCLESANLAGARAVVIRWRLDGEALSTTTLGTYRTPGGKFEPYELDPDGVGLDLDRTPVTIREEETPSGSVMRVLRLPTGTEHGLLESFGYVGGATPPAMTDLIELHTT